MEDSENTDPCYLYGMKNCYNIFFWRYTADCPAEVTHALRWHSEKPTNMYTVKLLMMKGGITLILSFPKAWFPLIADSPFKIFVASSIALFRSLSFGLRHPGVIASSSSKTASVAAEQRALLVFPARNSIETTLRVDL